MLNFLDALFILSLLFQFMSAICGLEGCCMIRMYVHVCVCVHVGVCTCVCTCECIYSCVCVCVCVYLHVYVDSCV